jgi:hypothetical protein
VSQAPAPHARSLRIEGLQGTVDSARDLLQARAVPAVKQLPGFRGALWAADRGTGSAVAYFLHATRQDMDAAGPVANRLRQAMVEASGARVTEVREHEVIIETGGGLGGRATHLRIARLEVAPGVRAEVVERIRAQVSPSGAEGAVCLLALDGSVATWATLWNGRPAADRSRDTEEFEIIARAESPR